MILCYEGKLNGVSMPDDNKVNRQEALEAILPWYQVAILVFEESTVHDGIEVFVGAIATHQAKTRRSLGWIPKDRLPEVRGAIANAGRDVTSAVGVVKSMGRAVNSPHLGMFIAMYVPS